ATMSASRSTSMARGERSPRLPMGVATRTSAPVIGTGDRCRSLLDLEPVPGLKGPALEGACRRLEEVPGATAGQPEAERRERLRRHHDERLVEIGDVDAGAGADRVGARGVAHEQGGTARRPPGHLARALGHRRGELEAREYLPLAEQPR